MANPEETPLVQITVLTVDGLNELNSFMAAGAAHSATRPVQSSKT